MAPRPALLFYCQSSLGLGHLTRSWALAESLASAFRVVMAVGGALPRVLRPPDGIETIELPAVAQDGNGRMFVVGDDAPLADVRQARRQMLLEAYLDLRPAVVVVELFPFGRRKFTEELTPLLQAARRQPRALVVSSVRDLLVDRGAEQQRHDDRAAATLESYFDAVLVHTDPDFSRLSDTFRPSAPLRVPVVHTGFVAGLRTPRPAVQPTRRILVSGGGGRFAEPLYLAAIDAHRRLDRDAPPMLLVAGPLCPDAVVERLRRAAGTDPRIRVEVCVADLMREMEGSSMSVSQCGYNTALDILRARVPALVVPFAGNGDSEQRERAQRLAARGALQVLPADQLTPAALADAMRRTLAFQPGPVDLDLDGAACTARTLAAMVKDDTRLLA